MNLKQVQTLVAALLLSISLSANNPEKVKEEVNETKATKAERPLVTSFYGGMMLTKLTLESQSSLVPYAYSDDADYAERCETLIGLLIFHTAAKNDQSMPSGMYVWDGEMWQQASIRINK